MKKINIFLLIFLLNSCSYGASESISSFNSETSSIISNQSESSETIDEISLNIKNANFESINFTKPLSNDENQIIDKLEVFEINDTHGAFYNDDGLIGISKVKTVINENTTNPYGVVKICNGDLLQGTSFSNLMLGLPGIAALNEMNFDCFTLGNHEFDWDIDKLAIYKDGILENGELNCPILGANIIDLKTKESPAFIEPYTIVNKGNLKVGIIGVIGEDLISSISKVVIKDYSFTSSKEAIDKYADILKNKENVDVLIVSCHDYNLNNNKSYVANSLVDLIINGHTHLKVSGCVRRYDGIDVPYIQSNTKNITMGKVELNIVNKKYNGVYKNNHFYVSNYKEDEKLKEIMEFLYSVIKDKEKEILGKGSISKEKLGIGTCNQMAKELDCDLGICNQGGFRVNYLGPYIYYSNIYEAVPFDNEVYVATLTGLELRAMMGDYSGYYYSTINNLSNGTSLNYTNIIKDSSYNIAIIDFLALKSYIAKYFNEAHDLRKTGLYMRDFAINYVIENYN